ncbi:hypothetical protein QUF74_03410 [Candidatus Halobeggiatoa sp. HSG11]|nr:hypothetical protein [Candidatus Halobeggiatoa sp. HSG11]
MDCNGEYPFENVDEIFMADVHKDKKIYLEDPKLVVPQRKSVP